MQIQTQRIHTHTHRVCVHIRPTTRTQYKPPYFQSLFDIKTVPVINAQRMKNKQKMEHIQHCSNPLISSNTENRTDKQSSNLSQQKWAVQTSNIDLHLQGNEAGKKSHGVFQLGLHAERNHALIQNNNITITGW